MNNRQELPPEVLDAVKAGRTIQAIKLLREEWDLGLKEAKHIVDAEMRKHPRNAHQPGMTTHGVGLGGVVLALIVAALAVAAYRFLVE